MATELEKLLGEDKEVTPPAEEKKPETVTPPEENPNKAKEEQLANLNIAIADEQARLRKIREEIKSAKKPEEEELPKINCDDPSAKAWKKQIDDSTAPANKELEKAKEERRLYALKQ